MNKLPQKIRALLAKAERASTPEEAEAYSAKAEELMLRHSIDAATLQAEHPETEKITLRTFTMGTYAKPKAILLGEVAAAFSARAFAYASHKKVIVHGWESDLETIAVLFESLETQAMTAGRAAHAKRSWVEARSFMTSFLTGFAYTVAMRLRARKATVEAEATSATPGTALVLVDRKAAVEAAVAEALKDVTVRKASAPQTSSAAAYATGKRAGERADLGGSRLGSSNRAAIS